MQDLLAIFAAGIIGVTPAMAQTHAHEVMTNPQPPKNVYAPAMQTMHKEMDVEATGDADVDFAKGMIPHHQGAIDMAKTLKEKGSDPELKKLADDIIAAQEKEIATMKEWLAEHETKK